MYKCLGWFYGCRSRCHHLQELAEELQVDPLTKGLKGSTGASKCEAQRKLELGGKGMDFRLESSREQS